MTFPNLSLSDLECSILLQQMLEFNISNWFSDLTLQLSLIGSMHDMTFPNPPPFFSSYLLEYHQYFPFP